MTLNIKYFLKNIILNPVEGYREALEDYKKDQKYKNLEHPHKKIWICGLPKSGTTLIEQILDHLPYLRVDRSSFRYFSNKNNLKVSNFLEYFDHFPKDKFSYVKTHLEYNKDLVENLKKNNFSIIISFRDLRDAMISRYYHILSDKNHWQYEIVKQENFETGFINSLTKNKSKYKNVPKFPEPLVYYYEWVKKWKGCEDKNVKKVWFEDFKNFPLGFIEEILTYIEFQNFDSKNILEKIVEKNKKDKQVKLSTKLNRKNRNVSTFRSGKAGQWKELFTKSIENEFNKIIPDDLNKVLK